MIVKRAWDGVEFVSEIIAGVLRLVGDLDSELGTRMLCAYCSKVSDDYEGRYDTCLLRC